jgi:acylphosphatase
MKHVALIVSGKVQGVCFRARTREKALELGISGFVRNEPDGTVRIEVEGDKNALQTLIDWAHVGPEGAEVKTINVEEGELQDFTDFVIQK